jgi:E3 ubiquitin-protein ligase UBR7
MNSYKENQLEWLLIEEKTHEPEEDEDAGKSLFEIGMEQLQRVDRVKALESLMAYKSLSEDIKNYFKSFESGKVITKEDIEQYFEVCVFESSFAFFFHIITDFNNAYRRSAKTNE